MYKTIVCLSLLLAVLSQPILTQPSGRIGAPKLVGGFSDVDPNANDINEDELEAQNAVDSFARKYYQNLNNGEELTALVKVERQVVAGMNYKLHYKRSNGDFVVITVYKNLQDTLIVTNLEQKNEKN